MAPSRRPQAIDPGQSKIPVFVVHDLPKKVLEQFFQEANDACSRHYFGDPQGFLLQSKDTLNPAEGSSVPLDDIEPTLFADWNTDRILKWARDHLDGTTLTPNNVVILDQRSEKDGTCLMCSQANIPEFDDEFIIVRSDFESALVNLRGKEVGVMGDDALWTGYTGFDDVFWISARNRAERGENEGGELESSSCGVLRPDL